MYTEFLTLCGFEPQDMEKQRPRVDRAFEIWEIGREDVSRAEERLKRYYDLELIGVRKLLGTWVREFIDMTLAKEEGKKIVYVSYPPITQLSAAMSVASKEVYCSIPEVVIGTVMGALFGNMRHIFEEAEKSWLPQGQGHCPFLLTRLGALIKGVLPKPDLLVPSGLLCDQSPITDDLIGYLYDIPVAHSDSCNDEVGDRWPFVNPRRVRYLVQEMKNIAKAFEKVTGQEFTEETLSHGIEEYRRASDIKDKIHELMRADPVPLSYKEFALIGVTTGSCGRRAIEEGPEALNILFNELKERVTHGIGGKGVAPKGAPKAFMYFLSFTEPASIETVEKAGIAIVVDPRTATKEENLPSKYESAWEKAADFLLRRGSRYTSLGTIKEIIELCREWNVEAVILNPHVKCRTHDLYPLKAKEIIQKELKIPVLVVEDDLFDAREFPPERFRSRVEPFAEMIRAVKDYRK